MTDLLATAGRPPARRAWLRYGVAAASVAVGWLGRQALTPAVGPTALPFIFFFPAVAATAWFGGLGPAVLATVLACLTADWFYLEPVNSVAMHDPVPLLAFIISCAFIVAAIEAMRRAESRLRHEVAERERTAKDLAQARDLFATTLASIGDGVITTDAQGRVTFLNGEAERLTGWSSSEAAGKPLPAIFRIISEDTREAAENPVEKVLRLGNVVGLANHPLLITRNGSEIPIDDSAAPIKKPDGGLFGVVLVFRDFTEQRKAASDILAAREELARHKEMLVTTLASIGDAVIVAGVDGCIVFLNGEAERLTGWESSEAMGQPLPAVFRIINEDTRQPVENPVEKALRLGAVVGLANHTILVARDGTETPIDDSAAPIRQADGPLFGVVLVFRDFTKPRQAQEALRESERRLQLALAAGGMGAWEWNIGTGQVIWSPGLEEIHGIEPGAFGGRFEDFKRDVHPEDLESLTACIQQTLETRQDYHVIYRIKPHDGGVRWLEAFGTPVLDGDGKPQKLVGVCMDVSERKRAEQRAVYLAEAARALAASLDFDRTLTRIAELMVPAHADWCLIDLLQEGTPHCKRVAVRVSDPARQSLAEELERSYAPDLTRPHLTMKAARSGQTDYALEPDDGWVTSRARDERHLFLLGQMEISGIIVVPLKIRGRTIGTFTIAASRWAGRKFTQADVEFAEEVGRRASIALENAELHGQAQRELSERKQAEAALAKAQRELQQHAATLEKTVEQRTAKLREMVEELQQVSYAITHDMRAPLRAMGVFAQMLVDQSSAQGMPAESQDYCRRIVTAAGRLDKLIEDALSYGRAVLQELPLEPVNLRSLLRGMLDTYPNLHPDKAELRIEGDLPVVLGNESLLTQCFSNLLGNAVKFVAPGLRPQVRVWAEQTDSVAKIWVQDNGIGIPKHAQPRLFGMFQKLDNQYEGTGIGLAIVRKVAERMGGRVGVESEPGQGSRFWVELRAGAIPTNS